MDRRNFVKSGAALAAMISAGNVNAARKRHKEGGLKHFVFINLNGAPSQYETFDPKPGTSTGGNTKAVNTKIKGVQFAEALGGLAGIADNMAVVRMSAQNANHRIAQYFFQSGGYLPVGVQKYPSLTSIVGWGHENKADVIPPCIGIGNGGISAGYLGMDYDPFTIDRASRTGNTYITPPSQAKGMIKKAEKVRDGYRAISPLKGNYDFDQEKKVEDRSSRLSNGNGAEVFDVTKETAAVRNRYGRGEFAASCLLTKRLLEKGVSSVQMNYGGWDTHQNNFQRTAQLAKPLDQGVTALVKDLKDKGLFDKTLILIGGEFGRTPRINGNDGRDHYAKSWSVALLGGGLKGIEIGKTDKEGRAVAGGVSVPQLSYCIMQLFGMNPNKWTNTSTGRPIKMSPGKEGIKQIKG